MARHCYSWLPRNGHETVLKLPLFNVVKLGDLISGALIHMLKAAGLNGNQAVQKVLMLKPRNAQSERALAEVDCTCVGDQYNMFWSIVCTTT